MGTQATYLVPGDTIELSVPTLTFEYVVLHKLPDGVVVADPDSINGDCTMVSFRDLHFGQGYTSPMHDFSGKSASPGFLRRVLRTFGNISATEGRDLYCVGDRRVHCTSDRQAVLIHVGKNGSQNGRNGLWLNLDTLTIGALPPEQSLGPLVASDPTSEAYARSYVLAIRDSIAEALRRAHRRMDRRT